MNDIKTNSCVRLKDSERNMLVQRVSGDRAICFWFEEGGDNFRSGIFPLKELTVVG
jgi:hypothetical protein